LTDRKHTNRLIDETSPYLVQHAHNPVDWYPWGDEAIAAAEASGKPILLSIGYSACHWCHVMERESFENEAIATLMNDNFINIKVDREERPDLDQIYMNAVQMMTGSGGWPMTVFLTPKGLPFFGGTYFPPEDRYNMPGFPRVLMGVSEFYRTRPTDVAETTGAMLGDLQRVGLPAPADGALSLEMLDHAAAAIARNFDTRNGGFGSAPKFPAPMNLEFLLRTYHRTSDTALLEMVTFSCRKMADGGIYDQLGGGFHRYSTDAAWLVPHFEKMLYDNAQLAPLYLHVYQITGDDYFRRVVEETLDYVVREMTDPSGGFYSTQDADSEGHEGKFFVWSLKEITELLDADDARIFADYYDVTAGGNFEGQNILNVRRSLDLVAADHNITPAQLSETLARGRTTLFNVREKRIKPGRDEKVLTAWNGLMMAAFAEAGVVLDRGDYLHLARNNAEFLLQELQRDRLLLRTWKDGRAKLNAYQEDYAYVAYGLIALYEATGELRWLDEARRLTDLMIAEFWDAKEGGFFFTGNSHETLIVRSKDYFDNATPSGNSVAADVLLRLAVYFDEDGYRRKAISLFRLIAGSLNRYGSAFGRALSAVDFHLSTPTEIALIGSNTQELEHELWRRYLPNKAVARADGEFTANIDGYPLLRGRKMIDGKPTAYVCRNYTCKSPVTSARELAAQLDEFRAPGAHGLAAEGKAN
jgi:uncharacterized protein YyaL (SSP411 family)